MNAVHIFQHVGHEGPGYLASFLERHGIGFELVRVDAGDPIPEKLDDIAGLVFMGGPMSVNDPLPWIAPTLALIRAAVDARVPVLGHCLGGQLLAKALGAPVTRNAVPEIGWHPVRVVESDVARHWLGSLPASFLAYHWHGETFAIPRGATRLLESDACAHQAFALDRHLGLQCHVEMTPELVAEWIEHGGDSCVPSGYVQSGAEMLRDLESRTHELQRAADVLYERWIQGLSKR